MIRELKQSFFQVFTVTFLWVMLLLTMFIQDRPVQMLYVWNIAGIAGIAAIIYGVMYNALWNHFSLRPVWNIVISSALNIVGGMTGVWLFSKEMFELIFPWWPGMLLLSVLLHTVAFYFYAKFDSKRKADELNKILK